MGQNIAQENVIDNLNSYLQWHNLPLKLNEGGVCSGLAMVHAKYALENREQEFLTMLEYVAGKKPDSEIEISLNHFAVEIIRSYAPQLFDKRYNQANAMEVLDINGKSLKSAFNFTINASDSDWQQILQSINLNHDEVMIVRSVDHTVSVSRKDGKYIIYDPNYSSGVKGFDSTEKLIKELHHQVFDYHPGLLGMAVAVIRHPDASANRTFPQVSLLYDKYLTPETINKAAVCANGGKLFNILAYATWGQNQADITQLLGKGASAQSNQDDVINNPATNAIFSNNAGALRALLPVIENDNVIQEMFDSALILGRKEVFDELLQHPVCKSLLKEWTKIPSLLNSAAFGGEPAMLEIILDFYNQGFAHADATQQDFYTVMQCAARGGSVKCMQLLEKNWCDRVGGSINIDWRLDCLFAAIEKNHFGMVCYLLERIPADCLQAINTMRIATIQKTDLSILRELKAAGVPFSETAQAVMAIKEHHPIGIKLTIGIMLHQFTDFCKEVLFKSSKRSMMTYDVDRLNEIIATATIKKTQYFKEKMHKMKPADEKLSTGNEIQVLGV